MGGWLTYFKIIKGQQIPYFPKWKIEPPQPLVRHKEAAQLVNSSSVINPWFHHHSISLQKAEALYCIGI